MKPIWKIYHLRTKLILVYSIAVLTVMLLMGGLLYNYMLNNSVSLVQNSLEMQNNLIKAMIQTSADASVRNYFRAVASGAQDIASQQYEAWQNGTLSEAEAKQRAWEAMKAQHIGKSGYIYILASDGTILEHPKPAVKGDNLLEYDFIKTTVSNKSGYLEYEWKNPDDPAPRNKSQYVSYFQPWDWIISASGYRDELTQLFNIADMEQQVLDLRFGETGYVTVLSTDGTFLIHPKLKGENLKIKQGVMGDVVRQAISMRNGQLEYSWQNPGEAIPRKKLMVFADIPEYDLMVAATAYKTEILGPIEALQRYFFLITGGVVLLVILLTLWISRDITRPLVQLKKSFDKAASGEEGIRAVLKSNDEVGGIAIYFNQLMDSLEGQRNELKSQLQATTEARNDLKNLNDHLEDVVEERTEELQASLLELQEIQKRLIEEERIAHTGRLIAKVGHHLGTPIGTAVTTVTFLRYYMSELYSSSSATGESLEVIKNLEEPIAILERSLQQSVELLNAFKSLQLQPDIQRGVRIMLGDFFINLKQQMEDSHKRSHVELSIQCDEGLCVYGYVDILELIFKQLISNSLIHGFQNGVGGKIQIIAQQNDQWVEIFYEDNGVGIESEDIETLFEGTEMIHHGKSNVGLGLNIVYNAIRRNFEGLIEYLGSENGTGARFHIQIPAIVSDELESINEVHRNE